MRKALVGAAAAVSILATGGCEFDGLNSLPMPGTQGRGTGSFSVDVELSHMSGMDRNTQVFVNNVDVGTVTDIRVRDWHAVATVRLNPDVDLPANATAKIGQTSLLGSTHIELSPPAEGPPTGRLGEGDVIPLERTGVYPGTEEVLATTSLLLNGGGLNKVKTITTELNRALGGRTGRARQTLTQLNTLTRGLDQQKGDIVAALEGLNRLSKQASDHNELIVRTLKEVHPALDVLNETRPDLTGALNSLGRFSTSATKVVNDSREPLVRNLRNLQPSLKGLADAGDALVGATGVLATGPFPLKTYKNLFRGDYTNLFVTLNLTNEAIETYYLSLVWGPLFGEGPGINAVQATDPLSAPLAEQGTPSTSDPGATASPSGDGLVGGLLGGLGGTR